MTPVGKKALLLGSGELGKEVAIELQRYGVEVVACDKYANAPAMQVAHRSHVFSMLDAETLEKVVREEKPDHIIPEIEAIATPKLLELEKDGFHVTPTARAARLTMNRRRARRQNVALPLCLYKRRISQGCRGSGHPLRSEARDELFRPRTKHNKKCRTDRRSVDNSPGRRTRRRWTRDCGRLREV